MLLIPLSSPFEFAKMQSENFFGRRNYITTRFVCLVVLNGGNENDLYSKISSKISCQTLVTKVFFFTNFHYHLILPLPMIMRWNEIYKQNEMIEVTQA